MPLYRLSLLLLVLGTLRLNAAEPVKIAVGGDPSLTDLADTVTASLSTNTGLAVLDRADLDKLGAEQALQAATKTGDLSAVGIVPADGLILLRSTGTASGVFARLVAVQPGVVLREVALPDASDPAARTKAIVDEFAPYWPKLAAIHKGAATALSLLGLRFDLDSPTHRSMERQINILLASRLSAEPDTFVLERWRLNDALFEKSLNTRTASAFWTGSSLIDGSIEDHDNQIVAKLRLRPAKGAEVALTDQDTPDHLSNLVDRLADKIHAGVEGPWNRAEEARRYADLGKWCLNNGLDQEAIEATETARALGDNDRATRVLQAKAYAFAAYPHLPRTFYTHYDFYSGKDITPDTIEGRISAARTAATLMSVDLDTAADNADASSPDVDAPTPLGVLVLENCLGALRSAYEHGFNDTHADALAQLRHALQALIGQLDVRLVSASNTDARRAYLRERDSYAGYWHDTPEATLDFYRKNLAPEMSGYGIRSYFFEYNGLNPPFLDGYVGIASRTPNLVGTPWIVAWDRRPADEVTKLWKHFIDELAASPNPVPQCDAMRFEFKSSQTDTARNACVARWVDFMQRHEDNLSSPQAGALAVGCDDFFYWASDRADNLASRQKLSALYLDLLGRRKNLAPVWIDGGTRLLFGASRLSTDEARQVLTALDAYTAWVNTQTQPDTRILRALGRMRQTIFQSRTELRPEPAAVETLAVTPYWNAGSEAVGIEKAMTPPRVSISAATTRSDNHLWVTTKRPPYRVFGVDPATLHADFVYTVPAEMENWKTPGRINHQSLDVSPQWVALGVDDKCFLCSRADGHWRQLDIPSFCYAPHFIGPYLYLCYWPAIDLKTLAYTSMNSGLLRVSLPGAAVDTVISSRRIPPQNALDGKPLGQPMAVWQVQDSLNLAVREDGGGFKAYATPLGQNAWTATATLPTRVILFRIDGGGALLGKGSEAQWFQSLNLLDATGNHPLLADPEQNADKTATPLWNFPDQLQIKPGSGRYRVSAILRGKDLCLYCDREGNSITGGEKEPFLLYFANGNAQATQIPLSFDFDALKQEGLGFVPRPMLNFGELQSTDYGLVVCSFEGFWVIPWSDIDAWLAKTTAKVTVGPVQETK